jgi:hypothetical protein
VLVVDRVELHVCDEAQEAGKLDREDARGPSRRARPPTKSFRSGTWARTLFAISRSAGCTPHSSVAASRPKNLTSVGMPRSRAAAATFAAGSIPRTGIPRAAKYWRRWPSLLATSTTRDAALRPNRAIAVSA